ncbi:MAG: type VII secretion protein EccE [Actinomycetota bacterium]|nr:type VII secretion protein EccE [Actinomycetota bacterium]
MNAVEAPPVRGFRFPRPDHRAVLLGLRAPQVAILGTSVVMAVALLMAVPSIVGLAGAMVAFVVGVTAALLRLNGRAMDEWAPLVLRWQAKRAAGQQRWVSPVPLLGDTSGHGEGAAPPPPLAGVTLLRVSRSVGGEVAVLKDARSGTFSAVVSCRGQAFALLDGREQERLCALWGQAVAGFAHEGSPVCRLSWVEHSIPEDSDALEAYLVDNAVVGPEHLAYASYAELIAEAGPVSQRHETYVVISVGGKRAKKAIRQAGGGDRGGCEVLLRELTTLTDRLRQADLDVDDVLGTRQLAGVLRVAFDPRSARPVAERSRRDRKHGGVSGRNAWPMATESSWDHYRSDSGFHATYWMAELPRRDVNAAFLHPLLIRPSGSHAVAVVMEPVPPSKAARAVESAHAAHVADEDLRSKAGYLPSARRQREHEAILAREAELSEGHAECRFSGYVSVSALGVAGLEHATAEIEQLGYDAQVELRRLYGEQDEAFTFTLPLGRGLR